MDEKQYLHPIGDDDWAHSTTYPREASIGFWWFSLAFQVGLAATFFFLLALLVIGNLDASGAVVGTAWFVILTLGLVGAMLSIGEEARIKRRYVRRNQQILEELRAGREYR